ncbi:hypothetical protein ATI02_4443 [Pseudomonas baetica]|uniref:Uncharacterized protein n=1 Tax=Pseudomonas baetica TaxID=674054 RepID=A0ABX4Q3X1_9PSED|nr:hypothetical protein ATI02_4443 [Pseudomonas baetica]PTC19952.1 hypothetical protein C0J26_08140 [Pseudomonas baetica]
MASERVLSRFWPPTPRKKAEISNTLALTGLHERRQGRFVYQYLTQVLGETGGCLKIQCDSVFLSLCKVHIRGVAKNAGMDYFEMERDVKLASLS